ncbi:hypothetical protein NM208_g10623 [Fusarium decemcellulare]|uniref:Uncharacterized protein n=1 Tax=Fusarium decemcellulare TaxID=57161 RepID=A0ACC1RX71_9HYPO|nr:hypothetical protein NM208_g10623 [Fusarium decemcellulare]
MEPLSALSIAAGVAQFLDFGYKIAAETIERYTSVTGALTEHDELESLTTRLEALTATLDDSSTFWNDHSTGADEPVYVQSLRDVVDSSRAVASDLLAALVQVRATGKHNLAESLVVTFQSRRKEKEIKTLETRFKNLQEELKICLALIVGSRQSTTLSNLGDVDLQLKALQDCVGDIAARQNDAVNEHGKVQDTVNLGNLVLENLGILQSQLRILDSLRQPTKAIRGKNVPEAYHGTFEWILDPNAAGFYRWLASMNGLFWVAGKPGSGKTTLMKFLFCHPSTQEAFQRWADGSACVVVDHFFGAAGAEIEQSLDGLLVSLLERVMVEIPQLTPIVCSHRWENPLLQGRPWSRSELLKSVRTLLSQTSIPIKICLFVDALDEFEGDLTELFCMLRLLGESSNIKLCVSSREWLCFEQFFHAWHPTKKIGLRLQHHTEEDIKCYVQKRLQRPDYVVSIGGSSSCLNLNGDFNTHLINDVISKANGVFLWVRLVCDQLVRGAANQDSTSMLQTRLDALPATLEKYFLETLQRMDPTYRRECARILLMMHVARRPLELLGFQFLEGLDQISIEDLAVQTAFPEDSNQLKAQEALLTRIQAYAVDMIDVLPLDPHRPDCLHLVFSHSSFGSFLSSSSVQEILHRNAGEGFSAHRCLCTSFLLRMKQLPPLEGNTHFDPWLQTRSVRNIFLSYLESFAYHMRLLEAELGDTDEDLMEFLDEIFLGQSSEAYHTWLCCLEDPFCNRYLQDRYRRGSVVAFAAQCNLYHFVRRQLDRDPSLIRGRGLMYPLLRYALSPVLSLRCGRVLSASMVNLLLERGASPMQRYLGMTACSEFAKAITHPKLMLWSHESRKAERRELTAIVRSLFEAGVPASTQLELRTSPHGKLQVQLAHTIPAAWLQIRATETLHPTQIDCLVLRLPARMLSRSISNLVHSTKIIVWVGYTLGMRWMYDAIHPHTVLDVITIILCLAPNFVLVVALSGREGWLVWLGASFQVANATAALRWLSYHMWEKERTAGEIRSIWELFEIPILFQRRRLRPNRARLNEDEGVEGVAPRRPRGRRVYIDSLDGSSDTIWAILISFLGDVFGGYFTFRSCIAHFCVFLVLIGAVFAKRVVYLG